MHADAGSLMPTLIVVAVLLIASIAHAACEQDLAATAEYGSLLADSQLKLQQELAVLRSKVFGLQKTLQQLEADKKKEAEKKSTPQEAPK